MEIFKLDHEFNFESQDEFVEMRKQVSDFMRTSYSKAKLDSCYYCKTPNPQFCNSHSIPAFVLRSIGIDGKVYNIRKILANNLGDEDGGINNSGTFKIICKTCDSKIFSDYENPDNYQGEITQKMMAQIAMKCNLKHISKKLNETALYDDMQENSYGRSLVPGNIEEINKLDLQECERDFKRARKVVKKSFGNEYYLILRIKLPYESPFATQDSIALAVDFDGNVVNQLHNMDKEYKIKRLYITVFPFNGSTDVIVFIDSNDSPRYRNFYKHIKNLDQKDQLRAINCLLLKCSEDLFFSKELPEEILNNSNLRDAARTTSTAWLDEEGEDTASLLAKEYSFSNMNELPNLFECNLKK